MPQFTDEGAANQPLPARKLPRWNGSRTDYPREKCIHEIFEEQAQRTPDAVAVVLGDAQLTYGKLNRRANALAWLLASLDVERELPVGVCMERSLEMIVGLLAILKAGGSYMPLDVDYPQERVAFMFADTDLRVLLTERRWVEKLPPSRAQIICLDELDPTDELAENLASRATAESLAYVMFTSGSTGAPKGVPGPHRGVVRLVKQTDYANFTSDETFLQLAPMSFDASTFEIWGPLLNGGKLVLMPPGKPSLEEIGSAIRRYGVTTLWLTAGLFNVMIDERPADLQGLRQLLAGGDVLSVPHVRKALRELKNTRLINGYGPTESTTFACCHTISPDEPLDGSVPIGRPIANTTAYILNTELRPVAVGETGELHIGGDGLARGYWWQPELTEERFISDPFSIEPGARLYKTGDLARWRDDGVIEFLGRMDDQVKIRGFRIEPSEIEITLMHHDGVSGAAVIARDRDGEKELAAFFTSDAQPAPAPAALREFLRGKLPDYMMPAIFTRVDFFPLTANGKVDRRALLLLLIGSKPGQMRPQNFVAPQTELEHLIAKIWRDVIGDGAGEIGVNDNFFEIGGNSIRLVEAHSKLITALRRPISLVAMFQYPTISALAKFLSSERADGDAASQASERARQQREARKRRLDS